MDKLEEEFGISTIRHDSTKPLLGLTILLVEDSRFFADAVRLLAIRSGARLRRADKLESARTHMRLCQPDVVMVDLCLPDGSGTDFIKEVTESHRGLARAPSLIAMSGLDSGAEKINALEAGAATFLEKPFFDIAQFQQTILSVLPENQFARGPVSLTLDKPICPDTEALLGDLERMDEMIQEALGTDDRASLEYCAKFLQSIANVNHDQELLEAVCKMASRLNGGDQWRKAAKVTHETLQARLEPLS